MRLATQKIPPSGHIVRNGFLYRVSVAGFRPDVDERRRSVVATIATESRVQVFDPMRADVIDEVLLMSGLQLPKQLPLLNSHNRGDALAVIGSVRQLKKVDDRLEGVAFFGNTKHAGTIFDLVRDGHLTDFSLGFVPKLVAFVPRGETKQISGRMFSGPVRVVQRARALEASVVVLGLDDRARVHEDVVMLQAV